MNHNKVSIIHAYIYRNLTIKYKNRYVGTKDVLIVLRQVIRKAPRCVYYQILNELEEEGFIKKINKHKYFINYNKSNINIINKLNDYAFTFHPDLD